MCMPKMPTVTPVQPPVLPEPVKPIETPPVEKIPEMAPPPAEKSALYIGNTKADKVTTSSTLTKRPGFSSLRIPLLSGLNIPQ